MFAYGALSLCTELAGFLLFFFAHTRGKPQDTHPCQKPKQKKEAKEAEEKKNKVT